MATKARKSLVIPTPKVLVDAYELAARFRNVDGLRRHLVQRTPLVYGAAAALVLLGLAGGAGVFLFLAGSGGWMALPAMALAPLVTLAGLFVLFYMFFSWVEGRALARALGHRSGRASALERLVRKSLKADLLARPAVPWLPAALFVALPLALLVTTAPAAGIFFVLVALALPVAYARLDAA
jgi:hypothetical protein